ncbi:MAG: excinuclease ABC subunit UvrC [Bdellovibrionota bacterium]
MVNPRLDEIREKLKDFPISCGVYIMKNAVDKIIYVGKAKNLRNRTRSYFQDSQDHPKTKVLASQVDTLDYILTKTEVEAFLLEATLIKKHRPKFNIRLKDDKSYPYIKLTWDDDYPRLFLARRVHKDKHLYFGPYSSGGAVHGTIRFLNRTFKIRDCTDTFFNSRSRPCLTHQIGRCTAPCVDLVDKETYRTDVEGALLFLRGKNSQMIKLLQEKMVNAAAEEKFEVAAKLRDSLTSIKAILEKQSVIDDQTGGDRDVVGYFGDDKNTLVQTLHIRQGRLIGTRFHMLSNIDFSDPREWLVSFLNQYYDENIIPEDVVLPIDLGRELNELLQKVLEERAPHQTIRVRYATDAKTRKLVEMANINAESQFQKRLDQNEIKIVGLEELKEKLGLPAIPQRIECYDISTFQGTATVASQVVFEDGVPAPDHYRRYKIHVEGIDDFASMREVLSRRFKHKEYEDPQLLVVDGGKGQLSQAVHILKEIGREDIPVVGLAKARTEADFQAADVERSDERVFIPGRSNPVTFRSNSDALHILVGIRDEAHRFAITYHRKKRDELSFESQLDEITGLGVKRKKLLLQKYGSLDEIRNAQPEEIAGIKTFNRVLADRILLHLQQDDQPVAEML